MSLCSKLRKGQVAVGLLIALAVSLLSSPALAQSDANPKWDLFLGYQWLHPGGSVPTAGGDPTAPTPFEVPDMPKGGGAAVTYNFDRHWGGEFDWGTNAGGNSSMPDAHETTFSVGPRFMARTDDANFFLHGMLSLNRLSVNGLNGSNGIGKVECICLNL